MIYDGWLDTWLCECSHCSVWVRWVVVIDDFYRQCTDDTAMSVN